jgi:hypothetical protein
MQEVAHLFNGMQSAFQRRHARLQFAVLVAQGDDRLLCGSQLGNAIPNVTVQHSCKFLNARRPIHQVLGRYIQKIFGQ